MNDARVFIDDSHGVEGIGQQITEDIPSKVDTAYKIQHRVSRAIAQYKQMAIA